IPAQSPTLSPTLSAMTAAFLGSSSGIPCSTLPTRSAPTSAALVKIPPPTRMNMARRAPTNPKPTRTDVASRLKIRRMTVAPRRPSPTVNIPATPPVRKARRRARRRPASRAALATRTFPRTASHIPAKPVIAEKPAPRMNAIDRPKRMDIAEWMCPLGGGQDLAPEVGREHQRDEGDAEDHPEGVVLERPEDGGDRPAFLREK